MSGRSFDTILDRLEAALRERLQACETALRPSGQSCPAAEGILARPNRDHERRVEPDPDFLADTQWAEAQAASRPRIGGRRR